MGIPRNEAKAVATLLGGAVLAQIIPFLAFPILTRLYSPEAFGAFGVFMSIFAVLSVSAAGRYDLAAPAARSEGESARLAVTGGVLGLILAPAWMLVAWGSRIPAISVGLLPLWFGLAMSGWAMFQGGLGYLNRVGDFACLGGLRASHALIMVACQTGFGLLLTGSLTAGFSVACVMTAVLVVCKLRHGLRRTLRGRSLAFTAYRHRKYPATTIFPAILDAAAFQVPMLVIGTWQSAQEAGQFFLGWKTISAPTGALIAAFSQFYLKSFGEIYRTHPNPRGELTSYLLRRGFWAAVVLLPTAILGMWLVPLSLPRLFGPGWEAAAAMSRYFILGASFRMIGAPLASIMIATGSLKTASLWQVISLITMLGTAALFRRKPAMDLAWIFALADAGLYSLYLLMSIHVARNLSPRAT
jgi:O-antigen/teichoic acid export membrane protein